MNNFLSINTTVKIYVYRKAMVSDCSSIQLLRHDFYKEMAEVVPTIHLESAFPSLELVLQFCPLSCWRTEYWSLTLFPTQEGSSEEYI